MFESVHCSQCAKLGMSPFCSPEIREHLSESKAEIFLPVKTAIELTEEQRESIFVLREGVLKVFTTYEGVQSLELLYPGGFFGGSTLLGVRDLKLKIVAGTTASICVLQPSVVDSLARQDSKFIRSYMIAMSLYLAGLRAEANELQGTHLKARIAKQLYKDFRNRGYTYAGRLTVTKILSHDEWSLLLRARRESITRQMRELEKDKIIEVRADSIVLLDEYKILRLIAEARAAD